MGRSKPKREKPEETTEEFVRRINQWAAKPNGRSLRFCQFGGRPELHLKTRVAIYDPWGDSRPRSGPWLVLQVSGSNVSYLEHALRGRRNLNSMTVTRPP